MHSCYSSLILFFIPWAAIYDTVRDDGKDIADYQSFALLAQTCLLFVVSIQVRSNSPVTKRDRRCIQITGLNTDLMKCHDFFWWYLTHWIGLIPFSVGYFVYKCYHNKVTLWIIMCATIKPLIFTQNSILQLCLDTHYWTAVNQFFIWGSLAAYFAVTFTMYSNGMFFIFTSAFPFIGELIQIQIQILHFQQQCKVGENGFSSNPAAPQISIYRFQYIFCGLCNDP